MSTFNATKPRLFDATYRCLDCSSLYAYDVSIDNLKSDSTENEIDSEISMFRPFCCEDCGCEDFSVVSFQERV